MKLSLSFVCSDSGRIWSSSSRARRGVRCQMALVSALEVKDLRLYAWSCMGMRSNNLAVGMKRNVIGGYPPRASMDGRAVRSRIIQLKNISLAYVADILMESIPPVLAG
jgi:hypothetical protein